MQSLIFTLRGIQRTAALEARVREIGDRLRRCNERISQCHVTVLGGEEVPVFLSSAMPDGPAGVAAKIHLSLPGAQIHADSIRWNGVRHTDVYLALREAYDGARQQLRDLHRDGPGSSLVKAARGRAG